MRALHTVIWSSCLFLLCALPAAVGAGKAPASLLPPAAQEEMSKGLAAVEEQAWLVAIRHFEAAQQAAPAAPEVLYNLGAAESRLPGRELRAIAWLQAYLAVAPSAANASAVRTEVGTLQARVESRMEKLIGLLEQTAAVEPDDEQRQDKYAKVAYAQAKAGDYATAKRTLESRGGGLNALAMLWLANTPPVTSVLYDIAQFQAYAGDYDDACESAAQLGVGESRDPDYWAGLRDGVYGTVARCQAGAGDFEAAEASINRARPGKLAYDLVEIAAGEVLAGRKESARAHVDRAVEEEVQADYVPNFNDAVLVYLALGDHDAAVDAAARLDVAQQRSHTTNNYKVYLNLSQQEALAKLYDVAGDAAPRRSQPAKERVEGLASLEQGSLSDALFTDPETAISAIAGKQQSSEIFNGLLAAIVNIADMQHTIKRLSR